MNRKKIIPGKYRITVSAKKPLNPSLLLPFRNILPENTSRNTWHSILFPGGDLSLLFNFKFIQKMKYTETNYQIKESMFKLTVKLIVKLNQLKNIKRFAAIYNQILDSAEKANKYFSSNEIKLQDTYKLELEYALDELKCIIMNLRLLKDAPSLNFYCINTIITEVQNISDAIADYKKDLIERPENCIS